MTGQSPFPRTLRTLNADNFRGSILTLILAISILALWTWWIFPPTSHHPPATSHQSTPTTHQ